MDPYQHPSPICLGNPPLLPEEGPQAGRKRWWSEELLRLCCRDEYTTCTLIFTLTIVSVHTEVCSIHGNSENHDEVMPVTHHILVIVKAS